MQIPEGEETFFQGLQSESPVFQGFQRDSPVFQGLQSDSPVFQGFQSRSPVFHNLSQEGQYNSINPLVEGVPHALAGLHLGGPHTFTGLEHSRSSDKGHTSFTVVQFIGLQYSVLVFQGLQSTSPFFQVLQRVDTDIQQASMIRMSIVKAPRSSRVPGGPSRARAPSSRAS